MVALAPSTVRAGDDSWPSVLPQPTGSKRPLFGCERSDSCSAKPLPQKVTLSHRSHFVLVKERHKQPISSFCSFPREVLGDLAGMRAGLPFYKI